MTATLVFAAPATVPAGEIVAAGVSAQEYLARYAESHHEWVKGVVIKMSPESLRHALIIKYLEHLFDIYFDLNPIGQALDDPFVMYLEATDSYREPDLQIILTENPGKLTETAMLGPADICIEVVSPESVARDYGDKFAEYEQAGVREYWIIDPQRQDARFYQLQVSGLYAPVQLDEAGNYTTPLLPRLALHVSTLWQKDLPGIPDTVQAVKAMLESGS
jgi:Uma2 family endonuclease